jgi:hypothetical protein
MKKKNTEKSKISKLGTDKGLMTGESAQTQNPYREARGGSVIAPQMAIDGRKANRCLQVGLWDAIGSQKKLSIMGTKN